MKNISDGDQTIMVGYSLALQGLLSAINCTRESVMNRFVASLKRCVLFLEKHTYPVPMTFKILSSEHIMYLVRLSNGIDSPKGITI